MAKKYSSVSCSLCGKDAKDIQGQLIEGLNGRVCKECVERCSAIYKGKDKDAAKAKLVARPTLKVPSPHEIKAFLDKHVIGQDHAKRVLSVAVHSHYQRIQQDSKLPINHPLADVAVSKSNVLLIGPSGVGKTLLAQTLAKMLSVPFAISDATTLTEAGYVGADVESMLLKLHQNADNNLARTEMGIVFVDEIDKIARKSESMSITRDVSGEGVQQALLKLVEGVVAEVPIHGGRKHPTGENISIDTKGILFIAGGAFIGLDKIVERRAKGRGTIGYNQKEMTTSQKKASIRVEPEDLINYGIIPELAGRLPVVSSLESLSENDLLRILTEPRDAILRQYEKLVILDEASIVFEDDAKKAMARIAVVRGTGARGLRAVVEETLLDIMFDLRPKQEIIVTKQMVSEASNGGGKAA